MSQRLVRPYLLTGGRTRAEGIELALEAQLSSTEAGRAVMVSRSAEESRILLQCESPTALVELAARLGLPIGVIRVLAGDLVREGYLTTAATAVGTEIPLLERLLDGLRADS